MIDKVGNVTLNYSFYDGIDHYSDGEETEEELLQISKSGAWEEALYGGNKWSVLYHFSDIRGNIIEWYPFDKDASILEIGSGCGAISGFLCRKVKRVVGIELSKRRSLINAYRNKDCENLEIIVGNFKNIELTEKFDYITLIGVFEYAANYIGGNNPYEDMLKKIKKLLKPNGKIFIAIENKMGLKYLNGAKEDHVGKRFIGMEDYKYIHNVRTFSKPELCTIFKNCGIDVYRFYYPSPDYKLPDTIYSDSFLPGIGDIRLWGTNYDTSRIALYNDAIMADQICRDKMFDYFSNSFLVICNEEKDSTVYAHYSNERKKEYQTRTTIECGGESKKVKKIYLKIEQRKYNIFASMHQYLEILQKEFPNINYLPPEIISEDVLVYDFINGLSVEANLAKTVHNVDRMLLEFKKIIEQYMACNIEMLRDFELTDEYKQVFGDNAVKTPEKSLQVTNLDMLLHNMIIREGQVYCIDYEWLFTFPIPFEYLLFRCIASFYSKYNMYFSEVLNKNEFLIRMGIKKENIPVYVVMERKFFENAYGKNNCNMHLKNYRKPNGMIEIKGL